LKSVIFYKGKEDNIFKKDAKDDEPEEIIEEYTSFFE